MAPGISDDPDHCELDPSAVLWTSTIHDEASEPEAQEESEASETESESSASGDSEPEQDQDSQDEDEDSDFHAVNLIEPVECATVFTMLMSSVVRTMIWRWMKKSLMGMWVCM